MNGFQIQKYFVLGYTTVFLTSFTWGTKRGAVCESGGRRVKVWLVLYCYSQPKAQFLTLKNQVFF